MKPTLPTNYVDDIPNPSVEGMRRYQMIYNPDNTVSFKDVTPYDQTGSDFGAGDINATNEAVNQSLDKAKVIDDLETIQAVTNEGFVMGALAGKALNESLQALSLKEITVVTMTMPSSIDTDTRQNLPSGYTCDNAIILSAMVNYGGGWQLSEPNVGFVVGVLDTNMIYCYARDSRLLNLSVKITLGKLN